jgi:hypothetical protein
MKKIFLFLFLLLIPVNVLAKDLYLNDLEIKNGELSLPFTKYNTEYTITLDKSEYSVDFSYQVDEDIAVSILDNYDLENNSIVTIKLEYQDEQINYYFHILKEVEDDAIVFKEDDEIVLDDSFMYKYKLYIIPLSCLFLIFLAFKILFHKHKI